MDKDYCLTSTTTPSKLIQRNINKEFYQTVRERKRHYLGIFQMKYGANILQDPDDGGRSGSPGKSGLRINEAGVNRITSKDFHESMKFTSKQRSGSIKKLASELTSKKTLVLSKTLLSVNTNVQA